MKKRQTIQGLIAATVLTVTIGLPAAMPFLEASEPSTTTRVESSHDPGECSFLHDHRICLLFASSAPNPGRTAVSVEGRAFGKVLPSPFADVPARAPSGFLLPARGPPPLG